ncbi:MAG: lipopolysaccharide biosynthesis protein [Rhodoluna sp.]
MSSSKNPRSYAGNAGLAAIGRIAPLAVQLIATPFIIATLGVDAYAVWAILATTISLMLTADLGVVGIMQRYHSVARANEDVRQGGRITATVLLFLGVLLVFLTLIGPWIADFLVTIINIGPGLEESAWFVFRFAGTLAVMQLIALALTAYLAAHNRFLASAVSSIAARSLFVIALVIALTGDYGLKGLVFASFIDAIAAIVIAGAMCWKHLVFEVRGLVNKHELKELWSYSWRNQASALGFVAQRESDVLMAAIMLPAAFQATIAASAQLAAAAAFAPTIALIPLFTNLSALSASSIEKVKAATRVAENNWFTLVLPFSALVLAIGPFATVAWLGPQLPDLLPTMALLTAGFLFVLANSVRAVYVRAIGKPGIESNSYLWLFLSKLALGIPATLIWGIYGLAGSTVISSIISVIVLWRLTSRRDVAIKSPQIHATTFVASVFLLIVGFIAALLIMQRITDRPIQLLALVLLSGGLAGLVLWWKQGWNRG